MSKPSNSLRLANVVAYVLLIAVNVSVSRGWLGPSNERLSRKNHTPITPAGWAFSIWGFIFLLQGAGVVYQALEHGYENDHKTLLVEAIGYWWIAGWICECAWQFLFQLQNRVGMWLCMVALLAAFFSFANALFNIYKVRPSDWQSEPVLYALYELPTSLNTAWLSVASCLGILIVLNAMGVHHLKLASILLAAVVTITGVGIVLEFHDIAYVLVLIWAFVAVFDKQGNHLVGRAALVCIAVCIVGILLALSNRRYRFWVRNPVGYSEL